LCETCPETGRGNPPVEWNQVRLPPKIAASSTFSGAFRYISSLTGGLPHHLSGLVRNDSVFECAFSNTNLFVSERILSL
ncbi:MAG: hypothetical protein SPE19_06710, partial [Candidatus Faecousia sp.]|nr:hypothetical protein [Candidatus Faecousia sp.]